MISTHAAPKSPRHLLCLCRFCPSENLSTFLCPFCPSCLLHYRNPPEKQADFPFAAA